MKYREKANKNVKKTCNMEVVAMPTTNISRLYYYILR